MPHEIDLWISCASTYTYLTVQRLSEQERTGEVTFRIRPFYLGKIFSDMGRWPFPDGAEKTRYMWRDIGRRAQAMGLSPNLPAPYPPPDAVLANQVAYHALGQDWGRSYLLSSYRHWFEGGLLPGGADNLKASLSEVGQDVDAVLAALESEAVHDRLVEETGVAVRLGIFGAPMFVVGDELFWGDDRMDDAVAWASSSSA